MDWSMIAAVAEFVGAAAVVASLAFLAKQVLISNRLSKAEAWRASNSDLNALNATFGTDPVFRSGFARVLGEGVVPSDLPVHEQVAVSLYMISVVNIYKQLFREVREGVLSEAALEFGGRGLFETAFFRSSWPGYRANLDAAFAKHFEESFNLSDVPIPMAKPTDAL